MLAPNDIIYLDNNATTQVDPAVLEEMLPFLSTYYGNPSSGYGFGAQVRKAIDLARERVAALLRCHPSEVVFTSGGTESSNTAIHSALQLDPDRQHVVTSVVEHSATLRFCEQLATRGSHLTFLGVDSDGNLDLDALENAITPQTAIVSLVWANNETGVLFPVEKIAEIARRRRFLFHADAVQAAGKLPINLGELPLSFLSVSAHKLHGPKGVGALYVNRRIAFRPMLIGGGQEDGRRSGTENVASIVGFGKAAQLAVAAVDEHQTRVRALRDRFEASLCAELPDTTVNGAGAPRLPNTSSMSFRGIEADAALLLLDQQRVCCSAGSACRTGSLEASHVLRAMNLSEDRMRGTLRFSLGRFNTDAEIDAALGVVGRVVRKLRGLATPAVL
jgi:cysteine desulfurase